ncbi:MAG: hypothetical protein K6T78_04490 [Alicyclobacillus sp.]|nr:hypothetical protein [Alicyclobacillus sp.]
MRGIRLRQGSIAALAGIGMLAAAPVSALACTPAAVGHTHVNVHVNEHVNAHVNSHVNEHVNAHLNSHVNEHVNAHLNSHVNNQLNVRRWQVVRWSGWVSCGEPATLTWHPVGCVTAVPRGNATNRTHSGTTSCVVGTSRTASAGGCAAGSASAHGQAGVGQVCSGSTAASHGTDSGQVEVKVVTTVSGGGPSHASPHSPGAPVSQPSVGHVSSSTSMGSSHAAPNRPAADKLPQTATRGPLWMGVGALLAVLGGMGLVVGLRLRRS